MKKKIPAQKFQNTEKVYYGMEDQDLTVKEAKWNGLTWMYSFEETDMRCGQNYLVSIEKKTV